MKYKLWNKVDAINGVSASHFLNNEPFKSCKHDIILIYNENGRVTQIECKNILANVYGIDINLDLDNFMAQYFSKVNTNEEETVV